LPLDSARELPVEELKERADQDEALRGKKGKK
jgi:hypothetical protein